MFSSCMSVSSWGKTIDNLYSGCIVFDVASESNSSWKRYEYRLANVFTVIGSNRSCEHWKEKLVIFCVDEELCKRVNIKSNLATLSMCVDDRDSSCVPLSVNRFVVDVRVIKSNIVSRKVALDWF